MDQQPSVNSTNNQPEQNPAPAEFSTKTLNQPASSLTSPPRLDRVETGQGGPEPQPFAATLAARSGGFKGFYRENRFYVWAIIAGAVIIALLAFFAFRKPPVVAPKEANVSVAAQVDPNNTAPAGGEAVYKITVKNDDPQKLVNVSLEVGYDSGVTFIDAAPINADNLSGTSFNLREIPQGISTAVWIKTRVTGNVNDTKKLLLKLHYRYSNFNSSFVKEESVTIRLTASDITLDLEGPGSINNAEVADYTLTYENKSTNTINNARIVINYPAGFAFASAQPQPSSAGNQWNLSQLKPGDSGTINFSGSFASAQPGEGKTVTAELLIQSPEGQYFSQNSDSFTTTLAVLPLLVSQSIEERYSNGIIAPGAQFDVTVKYQNNASVVARGVNIIVTLNSKALDMATLQAEGGQVTGNTILWNGSTVANLQNLNPSESGELNFSVRVKDPATKDSSKNLTIVSDIKVKSNEYQNFFPGNQVNLKVSSPVALRTGLAYQSGSTPPQVGKATLYSVNLQLTNSSNDVTGGTLTAFLPLGAGGFVAGSVNAQEASKVQYDQSTGKLTWQVGPLPAHTGKFSAPRTLQFGVQIIPSLSQVGDSPTLVKDIEFTGTDSFTSQTVTAGADDISTNDGGNNFDGTVAR